MSTMAVIILLAWFVFLLLMGSLCRAAAQERIREREHARRLARIAREYHGR